MIEDEFAALFDNPAPIVALSKGTITLEQVQYILSHTDISPGSAADALQRLGLKLCTIEP